MSSLTIRKVKKVFGHAKKADLHLLKKCIMNGVTALGSPIYKMPRFSEMAVVSLFTASSSG